MRFSIAAVTASLAALAQARINGIAVPKTIQPGEPFEAIILSSNYIQSVLDVAIAFGYTQGEYHDTLGIYTDGFFLGPNESNQLRNFNKTITVPSTVEPGEGHIAASLMSLYGVSSESVLYNYNLTVTFGEETSTTYVFSTS